MKRNRERAKMFIAHDTEMTFSGNPFYNTIHNNNNKLNILRNFIFLRKKKPGKYAYTMRTEQPSQFFEAVHARERNNVKPIREKNWVYTFTWQENFFFCNNIMQYVQQFSWEANRMKKKEWSYVIAKNQQHLTFGLMGWVIGVLLLLLFWYYNGKCHWEDVIIFSIERASIGDDVEKSVRNYQKFKKENIK